MAVINPLKVTLTNYTEGVTAAQSASFHPNHPEFGEREVPLSAEIWIERDDFSDNPPIGWQRLTPGGEVRLRYSYVIKCDDVVRDAAGEVIELRCSIDRHLGKNPVGRKVKGVIALSPPPALPVGAPGHDRLFSVPRPDAMKDEAGAEIDFKAFINGFAQRGHRLRRTGWPRQPGMKPATSSSALATSSPTATNTAPAARCSTARWG